MIAGFGRPVRALMVAAAVVGWLAMATSPASADYDPPRGFPAIGYGKEGLAGLGYGHGSWYALPYHSKSNLYGYQDYAYGRGPLINLGGAALQPGFRGYTVVGSVGYGLGMYPTTWTDQHPGLFHHGKGHHGHDYGHWYGP